MQGCHWGRKMTWEIAGRIHFPCYSIWEGSLWCLWELAQGTWLRVREPSSGSIEGTPFGLFKGHW